MIERAVNLAAGYVDKKEEVVSLLQIRDGAPSNQVLLRVRFAEVSRSAMTELGVNLLTAPYGIKNNVVRTTTEQFPAPSFSDLAVSKASSSWGASDVGDRQDHVQRFPEPVLVQQQGPDLGAVDQGAADEGAVPEPGRAEPRRRERQGSQLPRRRRVSDSGRAGRQRQRRRSPSFKEFGVRLNFTPIVNGDRVHLKVRPEVSTLDFNNAVVLNGFRIPALSTRRTETEIELHNGQTFAIAGLMNNTVNSTMQKIPGIGDIPILGSALPEQGGAEGADRAGRDDHAGDSAERFAGRDADAAAGRSSLTWGRRPRRSRSTRRFPPSRTRARA